MGRHILLAAGLAAAMSLSACYNQELADTGAPGAGEPPPPAPIAPPQYAEAAARVGHVETTELLGGPAEGPAAPAAPPPVLASRPVPNPEDLSPAERARIYGPGMKRPRSVRVHRSGHAVYRCSPARVASTRPPVVAAIKPPPAAKPAPVAKAAPAPTVKATPKAAPAPAPKVAEAKPAPKTAAPAPVVAAAPAASPTDGNLSRLGAALNAAVVSGAKLDIPADIAAGKTGVVSLTLPLGLSDQLASEAGKLGLTREALSADIRASLVGEGYAILPNGEQTARLVPGEAASFTWQVQPMDGAKGPLKALIGAILKGGKTPSEFMIGEVAADPATVAQEMAKPKKKGPHAGQRGRLNSLLDRLTLPGTPTVDLPGMGVVKSGVVVLGGLGLLVLIILIAIISRISADRRAAERRRKFRTMSDFTGNGHSELSAYEQGQTDDVLSRPLEHA